MEGVAAKKALLDRYNEIAANYTDETADEMSKLQDEIEAQGLWDLDCQVDQAMDALRCPDGDADVSKLSGGEKRRVALCKLLLEAPDILLLDEPTNHLDAESVAWLEHTLREYKGCVILVTHDRYFLDNVTGWILELDRGKGIPHEGNYSSFLGVQEKRLMQEGSEEAARERDAGPRTRMDSAIARVPVRRNRRRASTPMKNCSRNRRSSAAARRRSSFRLPNVSVRWWSRPKASPKPMATVCCSRTSNSSCRPAASSASSARTARARRRCSAC